MKEAVSRFAKVTRDQGVQTKLRSASNSAELIKMASQANKVELDAEDMSSAMRNIAQAELQKHGFPDWAINSMFLGEAVCW